MAQTEMDYMNIQGTNGAYGTFVPTTSSFTEIKLSFVPNKVVFWFTWNSQQAMVLLYDVTQSKIFRWFSSSETGNDITSQFGSLIYMDGTTLKYKALYSGEYTVTTNYMAYQG